MGDNGWAPSETDAMEVWQVARFMGVGDRDPVIRGSRGLMLPKDKASPGVKPRDTSLSARIQKQKQLDAIKGAPGEGG